MKKLLPGILSIIVGLLPVVCGATYIVHLEDGRSITVEKYWEEGDQIKFSKGGGVIGLQKRAVMRIEHVEDTSEEKASQPLEKPTSSAENEKTADNVNPEAIGQKAAETDSSTKKMSVPEGKTKELDAVLKEFDLVKERFRHVEIMSKEEIYKFDKDIRALRDKIISAGLGGECVSQLNEIVSMGNKIEDVLKWRGQ